MFGDLTEGRPVLADDNAGFFCFNQHLAGIGIKENIRYTCSVRHNGFNF